MLGGELISVGMPPMAVAKLRVTHTPLSYAIPRKIDFAKPDTFFFPKRTSSDSTSARHVFTIITAAATPHASRPLLPVLLTKMDKKADTSMMPNNMVLGFSKKRMIDSAIRMSRCHFSIASDIRKPAKNRKITTCEGAHGFEPSLKYSLATSLALAMCSTGKRTSGKRAVTDRGITSLIQSVAAHQHEHEELPMMIRTPAQRCTRTLEGSRGINITIMAIRMPMRAPMAAGDVKRLMNGIPVTS